jgi:NAD(P)-dependent dehydrogenase (short-subunit alcohol dehydrogenase family)
VKLEEAGAIVTGGGRGIGAAAARALTALGARVTIFARTAAELNDVVRAGAAVHAVAGDVAREEDVERLFAEHRRASGACDVLVNGAGILERAPTESFAADRFRRVLDVNLVGAFLCARAAIPEMKARRRGRIVNVASISATLGTPEAGAYNASKWGLVGLTKCLAEELRPFAVQCLAVSPGSVDTEMLKKTPFEPAMTPDEVARVIAWCAGEAPDAMTGANVEVFG